MKLYFLLLFTKVNLYSWFVDYLTTLFQLQNLFAASGWEDDYRWRAGKNVELARKLFLRENWRKKGKLIQKANSHVYIQIALYLFHSQWIQEGDKFSFCVYDLLVITTELDFIELDLTHV
jgi:hypothetical protein